MHKQNHHSYSEPNRSEKTLSEVDYAWVCKDEMKLNTRFCTRVQK